VSQKRASYSILPISGSTRRWQAVSGPPPTISVSPIALQRPHCFTQTGRIRFMSHGPTFVPIGSGCLRGLRLHVPSMRRGRTVHCSRLAHRIVTDPMKPHCVKRLRRKLHSGTAFIRALWEDLHLAPYSNAYSPSPYSQSATHQLILIPARVTT